MPTEYQWNIRASDLVKNISKLGSTSRLVCQSFVKQLNELSDALRRKNLSDRAVHDLRKELKRARATLRLLRGSIRDAAYRRANALLRDAAKPLTPIRDAKVLVEAFNDISANTTQSADIGRFRSILLRERIEARRSTSSQAKNIAEIRVLRHSVETLSNAQLDRLNVVANLQRAYKKARKAHALTKAHSSDVNLHEWRKQVKYLLSELTILCFKKSSHVGKLRKNSDRLQNALGDDHDLAVLREKLVQHAKFKPDARRASSAMIRRIDRRRAKLQQKCWRLAKRVHANKPHRAAQHFGRDLVSSDK